MYIHRFLIVIIQQQTCLFYALILRLNTKMYVFFCRILVNCLCYYNTHEIKGKFSLSLSQFHETQDQVHHRESSWKIAVHEFHIGFISF